MTDELPKYEIQCWGCEGRPSGKNDPCEVCGRRSLPAAPQPSLPAQAGDDVRERIARALHYPACWDTAAYPTLESAAWEAIACAKLGCSTCEHSAVVLDDERAAFDLSLASTDAHDPQSFIDGARWQQARAASPQSAPVQTLTEAHVSACALMIKVICMTKPQDEWMAGIKSRIQFMLKQATGGDRE